MDEYDCSYAYSAGDDSTGTFSIFDLRNLEQAEGGRRQPGQGGRPAFRSPTAGHKWNFDDAGIGTHTGWDGSSMWNVDRPRHPRLLTTTGKAGGRGDADGANGYNDFIHHNSFRPNAKNFRPDSQPSFANGNVLLVTEEDYEQTDCSHGRLVPDLARQDASTAAAVASCRSTRSSSPTSATSRARGARSAPRTGSTSGPAGSSRSASTAAAPSSSTSATPSTSSRYGYAHWGASEVWDAMWVPVYDGRGDQTGASSNVVYSIDLVRGLDVYSVDVPGDGRGSNPYPSATRRPLGRRPDLERGGADRPGRGRARAGRRRTPAHPPAGLTPGPPGGGVLDRKPDGAGAAWRETVGYSATERTRPCSGLRSCSWR